MYIYIHIYIYIYIYIYYRFHLGRPPEKIEKKNPTSSAGLFHGLKNQIKILPVRNSEKACTYMFSITCILLYFIQIRQLQESSLVIPCCQAGMSYIAIYM